MPPLPHPTSTTSALHTTSILLRRVSSSISRSTNAILSLLKRQNTAIIPADYSNIDSSQPPGTIIGIVLGSVGGFLLILWLLYTLMGGNMTGSSSDIGSVVVRERKQRSSRRGSSRRGSSRRESFEVREVRRERPVPVVERIVVEERRESRPAAATVVVEEESSIGSEDEVVVIEEHSPPRRPSGSGKKVKEVREVRESGYRTVDPLAYGGGDEPLRDMDRRGSRRSNR